MVAALAAKTPGNRVLLLSKGYGSCYQGTGEIDLLGRSNTGRSNTDSPKLILDPWRELDKLSCLHPYRKLGPEGVRQTLSAFTSLLAAEGHDMVSLGQYNMLLPSAIGSLRPVYMAPRASAKGEVWQQGKMLVVGINQYHHFCPGIIAENLTKGIRSLGMNSKVEWFSVELDLDPQRSVTSYDLALWLEQPGNTKLLAQRLKPGLGTAGRVGFPAVLGLEQHPLILEQLEQELGIPVFEIPTLPPCIPGVRLYRMLTNLLRKREIEVITGYPVVAADTQGERVSQVEVASPGHALSYQANNFILATGSFAGGGLISGHGWVREAIFDLPVNYRREVEGWGDDDFLAPNGHPYAYFGLQVDNRMRPQDENGQVCFTNLYAAGNILAHFDGFSERSGAGVDIVTGYAAGVQCRLNTAQYSA